MTLNFPCRAIVHWCSGCFAMVIVMGLQEMRGIEKLESFVKLSESVRESARRQEARGYYAITWRDKEAGVPEIGGMFRAILFACPYTGVHCSLSTLRLGIKVSGT